MLIFGLPVSFANHFGEMERAKGIEPSYAAWEAAVLPLNYTREAIPKHAVFHAYSTGQKGIKIANDSGE